MNRKFIYKKWSSSQGDNKQEQITVSRLAITILSTTSDVVNLLQNSTNLYHIWFEKIKTKRYKVSFSPSFLWLRLNGHFSSPFRVSVCAHDHHSFTTISIEALKDDTQPQNSVYTNFKRLTRSRRYRRIESTQCAGDQWLRLLGPGLRSSTRWICFWTGQRRWNLRFPDADRFPTF